MRVTLEESIRKPYNDFLCLVRALALPLHGTERLEEETSKVFNQFLEKTSATDAANFRGACRESNAAVENNIFLYNIDIVDRSMISEIARRSVRNYFNTVRLLRCNNHICNILHINALLKGYCCPPCEQFIGNAHDLERLSTICREKIEHVSPKIVFQLQETSFDKLH